AARIRADWQRHYRCGPAYVLGEQLSAHAIGLYFGEGVIGVSLQDNQWAPWVDQDRIAHRGLVVVTDPLRFPIAGAPRSQTGIAETLQLPLRGAFARGHHVYQYEFVAPKDC